MEWIKLARESRRKKEKERRHKARMVEKKEQLTNQKIGGRTGSRTITIEFHPPNDVKYANQFFTQSRFEEKIKYLKSLDLKTVDEATLRSAIFQVVAYQSDDSLASMVQMASSFRALEKGQHLYRIRTCEAVNCEESMKTEQDAWNPPSEKIKKRGRLNEIGESMLYVAEQIETARLEMKLKEDDFFWLIDYELIEPLKLINVGGYSLAPVDEGYNSLHHAISQFLRDEFSLEVSEGETFKYRISRFIAHFFYPYSIYKYDGWSYPSYAHKGHASICLKPELTKPKLKLASVQHCQIKDGVPFK
jgi:hypothetical protein